LFVLLIIKGNIWGSFFMSLFGWANAGFGHDSGHFAITRWHFLNDYVLIWSGFWIGNPVVWFHQHTYGHHSHTNEWDHDPDLHHFNHLRVHQREHQSFIYKMQAYKAFVLLYYTLTSLGPAVAVPFRMLREGSMYGIVSWNDRKRPERMAIFWIHLAAYIGLMVVVPLCVHEKWYVGLGVFVMTSSVSGWCFGFFSQINHITEASLDMEQRRRAIEARPDALKRSWAVEQVETSNNFAVNSLLWHCLSNGLNMQIEHHLFPALNHCHLHIIQPTVKATCEEYGVNYKCYDSWTDVFNRNIEWLNRLSDEPEFDADHGKKMD
jgi:fatty acid desaturase